MWIHPETKSPQDKYTYRSYHCSKDKSYTCLWSISFDPTEFPTNSIVYPITRHVSVITYIVRWLSPETDWLDIVMLGLAVWTGMPGGAQRLYNCGWLTIHRRVIYPTRPIRAFALLSEDSSPYPHHFLNFWAVGIIFISILDCLLYPPTKADTLKLETAF